MSKIKAGDLRNVVTWQSFTPPTGINAKGRFGQDTANWVTQGIHRAKIEPLSGREVWNARQLKATSNYKLTMRYVGDIKPTDRLLFNGRIFNVDSVNLLDEITRDLELMVTESNVT